MNRVPIVVPEVLMPKKDLENPCPCQDKPMETLFKRGVVFWMKAIGDAVAESEVVCELEIEKKTAELKSPASGVLAEQTVADGCNFSADDILGYIETEFEEPKPTFARTDEKSPIALYLLSGFLGSGKTTLLKHLLAGQAGGRIGVIVNEFGDVGIDGSLLFSSGVQMVEISGGSIFCACLKDGFIRTLKAFNDRPIDTLYIENSGMSDPSSMNRLLTNLAPYLKRPYEYRGSACMVDCTSFVKYVEAFMPLERQVEASTLVILNKTDLCSREQIEAARSEVLSINPNALLIEAVRANVPIEILREKLWNSGFDKQSVNAVNNRPETVVIQDADNLFAPDGVRAFCDAISGVALRIKGFFATTDGMYYVDVSSCIVCIEKTDVSYAVDKGRTKIVVIAKSGTSRQFVLDAWAAEAKG